MFRAIQRNRTIALPLSEFFHLTQHKDDDELLIQVSSKDLPEIIDSLVDDYRKHIDFKIPPLAPGTNDYQEFKDDPKIPLTSMVRNICKKTECHWMTLPGAILLIERGILFCQSCKISVNNMHRILVVAMIVSAKFLEDTPAANIDYARAAGFPNNTFEEIEQEFLSMIHYDAFITIGDIQNILARWHMKFKAY